MAVEFSKLLPDIITIQEFDNFHEQFIAGVYNKIKDQEGKPLSYGESQKSINVFLKTYVYRSNLPNFETTKRLRPFLHVPLDSIMIGHFQKNYQSDYAKYISPAHNKINEEFKASHLSFSGKIPDAELSKLAFIFKDTYWAWQTWFRDIYPQEPIILDTIWALERERD